MRIAVITDDTHTVAVRWEDIGRRRGRHSFMLPGDEGFSRFIAGKGVRLPLRRILHGRFLEVEGLVRVLSKSHPTDLFILSEVLGIVDGGTSVDVDRYLGGKRGVDPYEEFPGFIEGLGSRYAAIILLLPTDRLATLISQGRLFDHLGGFKHVVIVGGERVRRGLMDKGPGANFLVLPKTGIARVGTANRIKIIEVLKAKEKPHHNLHLH